MNVPGGPSPDSPQRSILVVGGGSGIGMACVELANEWGWRVFVGDIAMPAAAAAFENTVSVQIDVRSTDSVARALQEIEAKTAVLDGVIYTAGVIDPAPATETSDESWERMFDVHVQGAHRVLRAAHSLLVRSDRAAVCLTSSIAARIGVNTRVSYCAAKSAVDGMVRGLATEWAPDGIRVNGVAPGYTETPLMQEAVASGLLDMSQMLARVPMHRVASTSEIAAVMAFLISDQASYVTGQVIAVDGGLTTSGDW